MTLEELAAIAAEMPAGHRFFVPRVQPSDLWPDPVWNRPSDVDDHLTVAQRAEQWAHRHGVVVFAQTDPYGVMLEKRTPTGRTPSEPEMQDLRRHISNPAVIVVGADFGHVEMLVLAAMADNGVNSIILDMETCGEIPGRRYAVHEIERLMPPKLVEELPQSKRYLRHDPTKRHGLGRRR